MDFSRPESSPAAFVRSHSFDLRAGNGLAYRILISVPDTPPPETGYPVLYALDGNATFFTLAEAVRLQTRGPHGLDPAIVVGIGYPGEAAFATAERVRDYTTPADPAHLPQRPTGEAWPRNGGAEAFAETLASDIKPLIAGRYRIDPSRQALFGHSLGGYFTLFHLLTRPAGFSAYFAGSPSLWWDRGSLFARLPDFSASLARLAVPPRAFIAFGAEEPDAMRADARSMADRLGALTGFDIRHAEFAEEGHISVLPALLSRFVAFALGPGGRRPRRPDRHLFAPASGSEGR